MTELADLERRVTQLEIWREADIETARKIRHEYRNQITEVIERLQMRVLTLERAPSPDQGWMKFALGIFGAIIAFLGALVMGKK